MTDIKKLEAAVLDAKNKVTAARIELEMTLEVLDELTLQLTICGTDGHRLHAVESAAWEGYKRGNAPPGDQVIPWGAKLRGQIQVAGLEDARVFPSRWDVTLAVEPHAMRVLVAAPKGSGKKSAKLYPFGRDGVRVDYFKLDALTYSFAIELDYLLDALDFIGTNAVNVWSKDSVKHQDTEPFAFSAPGVKTLEEATRLAVVMPRRI